jgi:virulence-associated protein VapD
MRKLIPLCQTVNLLCATILGKSDIKTKMYSSVFEDNIGALQLARAPRMTPRTKIYSIKHNFSSTYVDLQDVKLFKIGTKEQRADILTKGLVMQPFQYLRKFLNKR